MREFNLPMSSTLESFDDDDIDDEENLCLENEKFHKNFSNVKYRLRTIDKNINEKNLNNYEDIESTLSPENDDEYENFDSKSISLLGESLITSTEFQEISPEINMKQVRSINRNKINSTQSSLNTLVNDEENEHHSNAQHTLQHLSPKTVDKNHLKQIHNELMEIHKKIVVTPKLIFFEPLKYTIFKSIIFSIKG
jgi:hypothetical protein